MRTVLIVFTVLLFFLPLFSSRKDQMEAAQKEVQAVRTNESMAIDGKLKESVWQTEGYSQFTQSDPHDGEKPTEKTTVWIAYDDKALYVAAFLYDSQPKLITKLLGRRDDYVDSDWFFFSIGPSYYDRLSEIQYVRRVTDSLMTDTFGARYVFGRIHQRVLSASIRLNWIFTPRLSLQLYLQPYLAVGSYDRFKELAAPRTYDYNVYGEGGSTINYADVIYTVDPDGIGSSSEFTFDNPDFNFKSLRGTIVFRWEYLPGSILYFVWTQNRADFANPGDLQLRRDIGDLFTAPGDNIFLFKVSYRWSI